MMNPKAANLQRATSNVTVLGGRLAAKLLEFLLQPLLKAQWQAGYQIGYRIGYEIGYAEAQAHNQVRKQRIIMKKQADGDVAACSRYTKVAVTSAPASGASSQRKRYCRQQAVALAPLSQEHP